jgi:hypothetical protein
MRNFNHQREDGTTVSGGLMSDGVVIGEYEGGHNHGVIGLSIEEALDLANRIQATYCPSCYGLKGEHDDEYCGDCARLTAALREGQA